MTLTPGTRLGSYEILDPIGAGGMGEVYRARDTKLGREVAIKVLPEAFAQNEERLARFEREARLLASLNHPNIATLYGLEQSDGVVFLAMELADGETLAERLRRGPIPVEDTLPIFKQIAEGLEAAHEKGIIHRDLKPANIKVSSEGKVKVLDFGLAKAMSADPVKSDVSESPTITRDATATGVILGTAAYMSPEQARGKPVDKRTDIWAFGCCLYEALTGKTAFLGETVSDTIAAILERDPEWQALPLTAPTSVRTLLHQCLQKEPHRRFRDVWDIRIEIEDALNRPLKITKTDSSESPPDRKKLLARFTVFAVGTLAGALTVWSLMRTVPSTPLLPVHLELQLPSEEPLQIDGGLSVAVSPDGRCLVYVANRDGVSRMSMRCFDQEEAKPIPDTKGASRPFFSPDGQWVGFFSEGKLKKISLSGGAAETICDTGYDPRGASWGPDGTIVFSPAYNDGLFTVPSNGGPPQRLTTPQDDEKSHRFPEILHDSEWVLFTIVSPNISSFDEASIGAVSRETHEQRILVEGGTNPRFVPTGHLLYVRAGSLMAVPFNPTTLEIGGPPVATLSGVLTSDTLGYGQIAISPGGTLIYAPGSQETYHRRLAWVDRRGHVSPVPLARHPFWSIRLSHDGRWLAAHIGGANDDVWLYDLERQTLSRLTAGWDSYAPIWSPNDNDVTYAHSQGGSYTLFSGPADGSRPGETIVKSDNEMFPNSWSPDGKLIAYTEFHPSTGANIWLLTVGAEHAKSQFLATPFNEQSAMFSPDGNWIAYTSDETGRDEVYIQPYPGPGGKRQVSIEGGTEPVWSKNGQELFYRNDEEIMVVAVQVGTKSVVGKPNVLFEGPLMATRVLWSSSYDVTPDGQHFVAIYSPEQAMATRLNVVLNWFEELKQRVPVN